MNKPSVFIGSSTEGLEFARAVRSLLTHDAEITIWDEGFFTLGNTFIDTLINALPRFDFAILVLTPDDLVRSREVETFGPRDNVLFELGLFMGRLGRSRTFMLHQSNASLKLPTDLAGVTRATYEWPREDKSYKSAVGAACDNMREIIRDLGIADTKAAKAINDIRSRQDEQDSQISKQQAQIRSLQVALQGILTEYEFDKLVGLSKDAPFLCYYSDDMLNELKRLRAMNLIQNFEGTGLTSIRNSYQGKNQQFDLKRFFYITEHGREYMRLRDELLRETGSTGED